MIGAEERRKLRERAEQRAFFFDVDDAAARLCRANVGFGLAKMHWIQERLGVEPDASYVSTPDSTVTRNIDRWTSGFGYGGAFEWTGPFMPLELKPNCCGMLAVGLSDVPPPHEVERRIARLAETTLPVDGIAAQWDMHRGNHFINLYRTKDTTVTSGYPYVVVMHSSGSELRGPNERGPGLYLNNGNGKGLAAIAETLDTPFGPGSIVRGAAAEDYVEYVAMVDRFARRRRAAYVERIFGDRAEVLFNETHQGLDAPGRMLLGCYSTRTLSAPWVPVTLQPELPAYLVAPAAVYAAETVEREGLASRAAEQRCTERLIHADLLPHGGGYAFPEHDGKVVQVDDPGPLGPRQFRFGDQGPWFEHVRQLPFAYRGTQVIDRLQDLKAGHVVATLELVKRLEG